MSPPRPDFITRIRIVRRARLSPTATKSPGYDPLSHIIVDTLSKDTQCIPSDKNSCSASKYLSVQRVTVTIDSIDRFTRRKTHASVVQGDSGKLAITFREDYISSGQKKLEARQPELLAIGAPVEIVYKKDFSKTDTAHYAQALKPGDMVGNVSLVVKPKLTFRDTTFYIRLHYLTFQTGVLTIPYKYHFGYKQPLASGAKDTIPNDLSLNLNVSLAAGLRIGRTRFYYDAGKTVNGLASFFGVFAGPTQLQLSSTNTFSGASKSTNQLGLTAGLCAMLELKNINFGGFGGLDMPLSRAGGDWYYANRFWIGFGVGLNLAMFALGNHQSL